MADYTNPISLLSLSLKDTLEFLGSTVTIHELKEAIAHRNFDQFYRYYLNTLNKIKEQTRSPFCEQIVKRFAKVLAELDYLEAIGQQQGRQAKEANKQVGPAPKKRRTTK